MMIYGQNEYQGSILSQWILENDAPSHMPHDVYTLENSMTYNGVDNVIVINSNSLSIAHIRNL